MTVEQAFLILPISICTALVMYEIAFILFFKTADTNKRGEGTTGASGEGLEDVTVQGKPLGYTEPSIKKYEICPTPVFELPEYSPLEPFHPVNEEIDTAVGTPVEPAVVIHTPNPRKNSFGKAPIIVVSAEIV